MLCLCKTSAQVPLCWDFKRHFFIYFFSSLFLGKLGNNCISTWNVVGWRCTAFRNLKRLQLCSQDKIKRQSEEQILWMVKLQNQWPSKSLNIMAWIISITADFILLLFWREVKSTQKAVFVGVTAHFNQMSPLLVSIANMNETYF